MIHINILDLYVPFDQVLITTPQEIWSNHQKGKMVKIRVLTEKRQFLIFDLTHDLMFWGMISRIKAHYFNLISWLKSFLKIKQLIVEIWSTDDKVKCYTKSQTLTFWSKLSFKDQDSSRHSKIWSLIIKNQESQKSTKKSNFSILRKFF